MYYQNRLRSLLASFRPKPNVSEMEVNKDVDGLILVLETVSKSETSLRRNTVKALGELGDPRSVDPLTELLDDDDKHLRRGVVEALGKIGNQGGKI